eukprot:5951209-Prymnesium_polylepis.1
MSECVGSSNANSRGSGEGICVERSLHRTLIPQRNGQSITPNHARGARPAAALSRHGPRCCGCGQLNLSPFNYRALQSLRLVRSVRRRETVRDRRDAQPHRQEGRVPCGLWIVPRQRERLSESRTLTAH